jgi:hypothetical protein
MERETHGIGQPALREKKESRVQYANQQHARHLTACVRKKGVRCATSKPMHRERVH